MKASLSNRLECPRSSIVKRVGSKIVVGLELDDAVEIREDSVEAFRKVTDQVCDGFILRRLLIHILDSARKRLTTPSSATPGRGRGCEHAGARRRRGLCRASWRAGEPVTEPVG